MRQPESERPSGLTWASATAWRTTYAGPQAHWVTASFSSGARFVAEVARVVGAVEPDIDLRPGGVTMQIQGAATTEALEFALDVQRRAELLGLRADPSAVQTVSLSVAHARDVDVRPFWTAVLGYTAAGGRAANDPLRRGPFVAFQHLDRPGRGRSHLDVSVPADIAEARVEAAIAAGGRLANDREAPAWWGLASPDNHGVDVVAWPDLATRDARGAV